MPRMIVSVVLLMAATAHAGDSLDRDGIAKVKAKVMSCQAGAKIGGWVKVAVIVGPDGKVTSVIPTANDKDLGGCVAAAIKTATFAVTTSGGSFSYPFVFDVAKQPITDIRPDDLDAAGPTSPKSPDGQESIDRSNVVYVVSTLRPKIRKCADRSKIGGSLKVRIKVKPDGRVAAATHEGATDPKLGQCIAKLFKAALFSKSQLGGVFTYPFNFGTATDTPTQTPPPAPPPATGELDRAAISAGVAGVKAKITDCATVSAAKGKVQVKVTVLPSGSVGSATVIATPDAALGTCVASELQKAMFQATQQGGSFSYPFVF